MNSGDAAIEEAARTILQLRNGKRMGWQEEAGAVVWDVCQRLGMSAVAFQQLGRKLGVAPSTVAMWRRRYEKASGKEAPRQYDDPKERIAVGAVVAREVAAALRARHARQCRNVVRKGGVVRCECGAWRWKER